MIVAQLVERAHPAPEVRSSDPVIGKMCIERFMSTLLKRRKQRKIGWESTFKKDEGGKSYLPTCQHSF